MRLKHSVAASTLALSIALTMSLGACATPPVAALVQSSAEDAAAAEAYAQLSDAAKATAVLSEDGKPVG